MKKRFLLFIATVFTVAALPAAALADPGVTDVTGVISFNGNPVGAGVTATVACHGNTLTDTTDASGTYLVEFPQQDCPKNQTVTVSATVNGHNGSNTGKATRETNKINVAVVNVNVVPELGIITAAGAGLIGAAGFMVVRRRQTSGHQA
jgi:hypothetical protein